MRRWARRCRVRSPMPNASHTCATRCTVGSPSTCSTIALTSAPSSSTGSSGASAASSAATAAWWPASSSGAGATAARTVEVSAAPSRPPACSRGTTRSVSSSTGEPSTNDPAAGCSIVPTAHPEPASSWVDSPEFGPTSSAYSWETTMRQTGYCSTRCTDRAPSASAHTGTQKRRTSGASSGLGA